MTIVKGLIIFKVKEVVKSKGLGKLLSFKKKEQKTAEKIITRL